MKRTRQDFRPLNFQDDQLKEVKLEEPDEDNTFYKRQKITNYASDRIIKEEEPDFIEPKEEQKTEKKHLTIPAWRPKIQCVTDFLHDDSEDLDLEMTLGSSLLFDNPIREKSPEVNNYDESDDDEYFEKQVVARGTTKVRAALLKSFNENPHPTPLVLQLLAEECSARYKTVFDYFENRRRTKQIKCERNDACERIKHFFLRETEEASFIKITDEVRAVMEEEIQAHLLSRKKFGIGYLHVFMERTGLHPGFIRGQYDNWRRRLQSNGTFRMEEADQSHLFSLDTLRNLEDAYLHKKYHCEEKEWGPKDIKALAEKYQLAPSDVQHWINRRNGATQGFSTDVADLRRSNNDAPYSRKLPAYKVEQLDAEFEVNRKPGLQERNRMAKELNLHELQVRNYFNKKRMATKKQEEWELARVEFLRLPEFKKKLLESVATERRKTAAESQDAADRIGVSYRTLCSFVEWRRASVAARNNNGYGY